MATFIVFIVWVAFTALTYGFCDALFNGQFGDTVFGPFGHVLGLGLTLTFVIAWIKVTYLGLTGRL